MSLRKARTRLDAQHHRHTLLAVLYLGAVLLLINAWLVSRQLVDF